MIPFLLSILIPLIIIGLILWAVEQFPLDAMLIRMIRVTGIVIAVIFLIRALAARS